VVSGNVELVQSALEAWNRREVDGLIEHVAEDVAWFEVTGRPESAGSEYHGRERLRRSLETLFDAWETYRLQIEEIHDRGDRVVAIVREIARGRASGLEVDSRWGYVITVEDGEIARIEAYRDAGGALEAPVISTNQFKNVARDT
jgi:ketosteroid isomerase-like protein